MKWNVHFSITLNYISHSLSISWINPRATLHNFSANNKNYLLFIFYMLNVLHARVFQIITFEKLYRRTAATARVLIVFGCLSSLTSCRHSRIRFQSRLTLRTNGGAYYYKHNSTTIMTKKLVHFILLLLFIRIVHSIVFFSSSANKSKKKKH